MKSPVDSLCFPCSSVRKRVRVTMSVLIFSCPTGGMSPLEPLVAMVVGLFERSFEEIDKAARDVATCERAECLGCNREDVCIEEVTGHKSQVKRIKV